MSKATLRQLGMLSRVDHKYISYLYLRFAVASEYTDGNGGTTDLQAYYNITLTLREPDPNFGKTAFTTSTVHMDRPITLDAGKSWFIRYIMIPPIAPQSSLTSRD